MYALCLEILHSIVHLRHQLSRIAAKVDVGSVKTLKQELESGVL